MGRVTPLLVLVLHVYAASLAAAAPAAAHPGHNHHHHQRSLLQSAKTQEAAATRPTCGTRPPPPHVRKEAERKLAVYQNRQRSKRAALASFPIVSVRTVVYIITDGATGDVSAQLPDQVAVLNAAFASASFNFSVEPSDIHVVNNSTWFSEDIYSQYEEDRRAAVNPAPDPSILYVYIKDLLANSGCSCHPYGASSYPESGGTWDGVSLHYEALPGSTLPGAGLGYTLVHQVGHWVGLMHTYSEGSPTGEPSCDDGGDYVSDTPAELVPAFGCPLGRDSCNGFNNPAYSGLDPVTNFMNQADDDCGSKHFTPKQIVKMHAEWEIFRANGVGTTDTCVEPPSQVTDARPFYGCEPGLPNAVCTTACMPGYFPRTNDDIPRATCGAGTNSSLGYQQWTVEGNCTAVNDSSTLCGVTSLSVGWDSVCAALNNGDVLCFGRNSKGQLGVECSDGLSSDNPAICKPAKVPGLLGRVQSLSTGVAAEGTCAILDDGSVMGSVHCWGKVMSLTYDREPSPVTGLAGKVTKVTRGEDFTCFLLTTRIVQCLGNNFYGQLGTGNTLNSVRTPVTVLGLSGAVDISAGQAHACAVLQTGGVLCWGRVWNGTTTLGDAGATYSSTSSGAAYSAVPVAVLGLAGQAVKVAASVVHTCVLLSDRRVQCWGDNKYGELGDGTSDNASATPRTVKDNTGADLTGVVAISTGWDTSYALVQPSADVPPVLKGWGANWKDQLNLPQSAATEVCENNSADCRKVATPIPGQTGTGGVLSAVQGGGFITCVVVNRAIRCFGAFEDFTAPEPVFAGIGLVRNAVIEGIECSWPGCSGSPASVANAQWPNNCNGSYPAGQCLATCNDGYEGAPFAMCNTNGTWDVSGSCQPKPCTGSPVDPTGGFFSCGASTQSGNSCYASCASGLGMPYSVCSASRWEPVNGACQQPVPRCYGVPNGGKNPTGGTWPLECSGMPRGDVCTAKCDQGFSGSPSATCENGLWSAVTGVCTSTGGPGGANCAGVPLPVVADAKWSPCATVSQGSVCNATCNTGLVGGRSAVCESGTWRLAGVCTADVGGQSTVALQITTFTVNVRLFGTCSPQASAALLTSLTVVLTERMRLQGGASAANQLQLTAGSCTAVTAKRKQNPQGRNLLQTGSTESNQVINIRAIQATPPNQVGNLEAAQALQVLYRLLQSNSLCNEVPELCAGVETTTDYGVSINDAVTTQLLAAPVVSNETASNCSAGQQYNRTSGACAACPQATVNPLPGSTCSPCSVFNSVPNANNTACDNCTAGSKPQLSKVTGQLEKCVLPSVECSAIANSTVNIIGTACVCTRGFKKVPATGKLESCVPLNCSNTPGGKLNAAGTACVCSTELVPTVVEGVLVVCKANCSVPNSQVTEQGTSCECAMGYRAVFNSKGALVSCNGTAPAFKLLADTASAVSGRTKIIRVLRNDQGPGKLLITSASNCTKLGTIVVSADGKSVVYLSRPGFTGKDTCRYTVAGHAAAGKIHVAVTAGSCVVHDCALGTCKRGKCVCKQGSGMFNTFITNPNQALRPKTPQVPACRFQQFQALEGFSLEGVQATVGTVVGINFALGSKTTCFVVKPGQPVKDVTLAKLDSCPSEVAAAGSASLLPVLGQDAAAAATCKKGRYTVPLTVPGVAGCYTLVLLLADGTSQKTVLVVNN